MWTRFADHHPGQRLLKIAAHTGLTEDRTRSPAPREQALHNGRQPQKLLECGRDLEIDYVAKVQGAQLGFDEREYCDRCRKHVVTESQSRGLFAWDRGAEEA